MPKFIHVPLVLGALALAGCADCSRDPSQVGLGCATANLTTGVYQEDDAKIRREIAALDARRGLLEEQAALYRADAQRLRGARRTYAQRLANLNSQTAALNQQVSDLNRRTDVNRQELLDLRAEERRLSGEVLALGESGGSEDQAEIDRLNARVAALQDQIRRLARAS
ncbi:MAG: hypothetical protein AAGK00_15070 [Pseudomonadota bacterium]